MGRAARTETTTAALGAMFAQSILGGGLEFEEDVKKKKRSTSYFGQLFLMTVGAVFLSMSLAATEEMVLISYQMTDWHTLALMIFTMKDIKRFLAQFWPYKNVEAQLMC